MAPKFGTSGLRGLVVELTDEVVTDHIRAFLNACDIGPALYIGRDLRDSSPHLADVVARAALDLGHAVVDCGALPTPALALAALGAGAGAVMITGSHIPADRNGLKFYTPRGEITKADENAIVCALGHPGAGLTAAFSRNETALHWFHTRYLAAFGARALKGAKIGVYSHSSVGRDLLIALLGDLGASVTELGRATSFIPVDTEAVDIETRAQLRAWAAAMDLDAILSTDGDADRPLLSDASGTVVPGDILGQITARVLGAEVVVTPVSSNSGADLGGHFTEVTRTKIGSPFVIAAMEAHVARPVVGYEANGGFLLGFDAQGPAGPLPALATRDCVLPLLSVLVAARRGESYDVAALVAEEPARFTAADRLVDTPTEASQALIGDLVADPAARTELLTALGLHGGDEIDTTDGMRIIAADGTVVHFRPSGNAPEFRVYIEADTGLKAGTLLTRALALVRARIG